MLLPNSSPYVSGEASVLGALVSIGEERSRIALPYQMRMFLVECLLAHLRDPEITHHFISVDVLTASMEFGEQAIIRLKRAGDESLILAGLYPERARRLNVSSTYFSFLGQTAYATLASRLCVVGKPECGKFYDSVVKDFDLLVRVLGGTKAGS